MSEAAPSLFNEPRGSSSAFVLTNRFTLLDILSSRLIMSREGYDDERYYTDLFERAPARIPVIAGGASRALQAVVQADSPTAFPVLIELDPSRLTETEVPALAADQTSRRAALSADGVAAWAPTGPIPLSAATAVHFRTPAELDEHRVRRFDNVPTDVELLVTPILFDRPDDAADALVKWLVELERPALGDVAASDRISGALTLIAAALPSGEAPMALFRDLLAGRMTGKRPRKGGSQHGGWLLSLVAGARRGGSIEDRLFEASVNTLKEEDPGKNWHPIETVMGVADLAKKRLAADERDVVVRHTEGITAILRNDRDFRPFRADVGLTTAKALLMAVMRPDPADLLDWPQDQSGADDETRITAAALCGLMHGRKRITTALREPALDNFLAQQEAGVAAVSIDSVTPVPDTTQITEVDESIHIRLRRSKMTILTRKQLAVRPEAPASIDGASSPEYISALQFAVEAHVGRASDGIPFPYVSHPIRVAEILARHAIAADAVVAGLLHDTLAGTGTTRDELSDRFGERVAFLVTAVSELSKPEGTEASAPQRLEHSVEPLMSEQDEDVLRIIAAEKLDNIRSLREALAERGASATWAGATIPRAAQAERYRRVADTLCARVPGELLFQLLQLEVQAVFPSAAQSADTLFFYAHELRAPEQARPYLADPKIQWKQGRSAYELAHSWIGAGGIPPAVSSVLEGCELYVGCKLVEGFFERQVALRTPGRASQTDLLVLLQLQSEHAVVAVEGKAGESFDKMVGDWNTTEGKERRLQSLCADLGFERSLADNLRYQLLHRTASALYEAERYGARHALLLVHSFAEDAGSFTDFQRFSEALGTPIPKMNIVSAAVELGAVSLRVAWVQDAPRTR